MDHGPLHTCRWTLAEAERRALIRLARRTGLSEADAEDCVQEAILRVVLHADLDEARIGKLLATVVKWRAIDMHRRSRLAVRATSQLDAMGRDHLPAADDLLCDRAEAAWAAAVVRGLPPLQQLVLTARAGGHSWSEIADELSTSVKAVESAASRGRATVRYAIRSTLDV